MGDSGNFVSKYQVFDVTESQRFDDDGRLKRTGN